jgi:predicted ATPase/DNA-binding CsgD family transcriptional regulator
VEQIAARLKDPLKLLTMGDRTAPPRQQTLREALGWSYNLLNEAEARLFNRLSVCVGGWTLEAAEVVGTGDGIDEDDVLGLLSALVNKSLVVAEANGDGAVRFRMLDLVRQYGRERLEQSGESDTVCQQYTEFCLELADADEPEFGEAAEPWHETIRAQTDEAAWEVAWAEQQAITLEGAAENTPSEELLTPMPEEPPADRRLTPLTRREQEVAALVGRGLTNRQISAQLVLSEHTVAKHVRKILKKLGLHSRAQIAAWVAK